MLKSKIIILDNTQGKIVNNHQYDYCASKIMNYQKYHQCLNYPKEDFFSQKRNKDEKFYWEEIFLNSKINLSVEKVGKILSVNHELWDLYVPCVFMILEYKEKEMNYLFISTHLTDKANEKEQIKLCFSKEIVEIFNFMENEPDLVCHVDSEFYEKEVIMNYVEAQYLSNQVLPQNSNIVKVKI